MSAIFGILRFDGGGVSARELERMGNTLAHRAPDGRKFVTDGAVGLGHCLMRVNQEDAFECQPLIDREADLTLVADCRIDNREALADVFGLSAADTRDMPDSAFILRAYKKWGEAAPEHLLGDFAFAVWDGRARKLVLARDHMGQRYVLYHRGKTFLAFATESKALWAVPDVPRQLSDAYIAEALLVTWRDDGGRTPYEGITGLPGGATLVAHRMGEVAVRHYWNPQAASVHEGKDLPYYIGAYRQILGEAVACRLRRLLRPPALCFSGGIDSGSIAVLADTMLSAQRRKMIAVASVLPESASDMTRPCSRSDVELYRKSFDCLDIRYYERGSHTATDNLEKSFLVTETFGGNNYVYNGLYRLAAENGARLMLDGHGGDYTLNPRAHGALARLLVKGRFIRFARELLAYRKLVGRSYWRILRSDVTAMLPPPWLRRAVNYFRRGFRSEIDLRVIAPNFMRKMYPEGKISAERLRGTPLAMTKMHAQAMRAIELQRSLFAPGLSILAASHGLELSRPFHDKRVVELALAIPEDLYMIRGQKRFLARAALGERLPRIGAGPNPSHDPDFDRMLESIMPELAAEAGQLVGNPELSGYVDFTEICNTLSSTKRRKGFPPLADARHALRGIVVARFVQWFSGANPQSSARADENPT